MDKRRFALLSWSHFSNDIYGNTLTSLLPFLIPALGISLPMAGLLVATYQMTSSIVQPVLGHLADRFGTRLFSSVGTVAVAVAASSIGLAPGYVLLLALVAVHGLGTATFHPQSAAMVNSLAGRRRGTVMSVYITAGNAGFALGPMIVVPVVTALGLRATPLLALPGLVSAVLLALYAPRNWLQPRSGPRTPLWQVLARKRAALASLLGVATFRSVTMFAFMAFLPLLFQSRGYPPTLWAALVTFFLLSGTVGGLLGGYLSDQIGRKWVIAGSLVMAVPLLLAMVRAEDAGLWVATFLAGATIMASFSVLTVKAQEMLPENVGMASGLILGFGMGVGGLGIWPASLLAERIGLFETMSLLALLPIPAALVALTLPEGPRVRAQEGALRGQVDG